MAVPSRLQVHQTCRELKGQLAGVFHLSAFLFHVSVLPWSGAPLQIDLGHKRGGPFPPSQPYAETGRLSEFSGDL